jgi:hypothetical protein
MEADSKHVHGYNDSSNTTNRTNETLIMRDVLSIDLADYEPSKKEKRMKDQQNDEFRLSGPSQKSPAARDVGSSALSATPN